MRAEFIDPGGFRHECVVEEPMTTPDGAGGQTVTWSEVATLFARIEPMRATSRFAADRQMATVTHRATLRFRTGIAAGMRLRRNGRAFDIETVHAPDESGRYLVCTLKEHDA